MQSKNNTEKIINKHTNDSQIVNKKNNINKMKIDTTAAAASTTTTTTTTTTRQVSWIKKHIMPSNEDVDDMIFLSDLSEGALLRNLRRRYERNQIYTYTGSILVAVNPYKMFDIYNLEMVKKYESHLFGTLPPHLFAIGSSAYSKMMKDQMDQVIVISGESGAGKTESTKLLMQYLAAVNRSPSNIITEQILEANPLLESFGNAKTIRNDNSSRFGKYLEVYFKEFVFLFLDIKNEVLELNKY
jgi:myosin XV